jgi:hypothetical protein
MGRSALRNGNGLVQALAANAREPDPIEAPRPSENNVPIFSNYEVDDTEDKAKRSACRCKRSVTSFTA